jgi:hypothetical protein
VAEALRATAQGRGVAGSVLPLALTERGAHVVG